MRGRGEFSGADERIKLCGLLVGRCSEGEVPVGVRGLVMEVEGRGSS